LLIRIGNPALPSYISSYLILNYYSGHNIEVQYMLFFQTFARIRTKQS